MLPYSITDNSVAVTLMTNGRFKEKVLDADHPNFKRVLDAIDRQAWDEVERLMDVGSAISTYSEGQITVEEGTVRYKGQPLHNAITRRILALMRDGHDIKPVVRFLDNFMSNPDFRIKHSDELWNFLERNNRPLTEDGCFLADKGVREDFTDQYTGTIDNSPGQIVEVDRGDVDPDPDRTCSHGLHVGNFNYVRSFGTRKLLVKVNPRDVVAVPADYNATKMRVCRYEVLGEMVDYDGENDRLDGQSLYNVAPASSDSTVVWKFEVEVHDGFQGGGYTETVEVKASDYGLTPYDDDEAKDKAGDLAVDTVWDTNGNIDEKADLEAVRTLLLSKDRV